jgi:hypothetical protein
MILRLRNAPLFSKLPRRLLRRRRLEQQYRLLKSSGLFNPEFYRQCQGLKLSQNEDPLRHYLIQGWRQGCNPNPLFDGSWYLAGNPDVAQQLINPLAHFVQSGSREGRIPHPLFDVRGYEERNSEIDKETNPLTHYLNVGSGKAGDPHVLFRHDWYLERNPDVAQLGVNPLVQFLQEGWKQGRNPHPLFHTSYYLSSNPDVALHGVNPLLHFVTIGFTENRKPNPLFDTAYYRQLYDDVGASGSNPLVHYLTSGASELRRPHPLLDPGHYLREAHEFAGSILNPLEHYFEFGAKRHLSPHVLFDPVFYREQHPSLASHPDLLLHYLTEGAQLGYDPCELFDSSFYLETYPQVAQSGENPLVHYLTSGAQAGFNPNPLFDSAFYLRQYPDVEVGNMNPLEHYVVSGAREGRSTSPFFSSYFYLKNHPQLKKTGVNPLTHYLRGPGVQEGRDPNPFFSTSAYLKEHPEVASAGLNPLVHLLQSSKASTGVTQDIAVPSIPSEVRLRIEKVGVSQRETSPNQKVICVTHVSPLAPRAGNEYRVRRLLDWLKSERYDVLPIISPLQPEPSPADHVLKLASEYGGAVLSMRSGQTFCCLDESDMRLLFPDDGEMVPSYRELLGEDKPVDRRTRELIDTDRAFCHDALIHVVTKLTSAAAPCVLLSEYIFMSRMLPLVDSEVLKIIDTHDVFSSKQEKVIAYGVADSLGISEDEERERLLRADLVLAIQPDEQEKLTRIVNQSRRVITVGVDFAVTAAKSRVEGQKVLYVGSDNAMNVQGLRDFLRFAWPAVRKQVPEAELLVAGRVCDSVRCRFPGVRLLGPVRDLSDLYRQTKVTINPSLAGTGLKVKTLEALSFLQPVVTWSTGTDGLRPELTQFCKVATDWFEFRAKLADILLDTSTVSFGEDAAQVIQRSLSPETTYAAMREELVAFFQRAEAVQAAG